MAVGIPATPWVLWHVACIASQRFGFVVDTAVLGGPYALVRTIRRTLGGEERHRTASGARGGVILVDCDHCRR